MHVYVLCREHLELEKLQVTHTKTVARLEGKVSELIDELDGASRSYDTLKEKLERQELLLSEWKEKANNKSNTSYLEVEMGSLHSTVAKLERENDELLVKVCVVHSHLVYPMLLYQENFIYRSSVVNPHHQVACCVQFFLVYQQHLVYPIPGSSNTWFIPHLVCPRPGLSNTWFTQHLVYPAPGSSNTWFIPHLVYPTPGLPSTWFTQYICGKQMLSPNKPDLTMC